METTTADRVGKAFLVVGRLALPPLRLFPRGRPAVSRSEIGAFRPDPSSPAARRPSASDHRGEPAPTAGPPDEGASRATNEGAGPRDAEVAPAALFVRPREEPGPSAASGTFSATGPVRAAAFCRP